MVTVQKSTKIPPEDEAKDDLGRGVQPNDGATGDESPKGRGRATRDGGEVGVSHI